MASMERPQPPRAKSSYSFRSEKSHKSQGSIGSKPKESSEEKRRSHFSPTGKANPNAAINEAQPIAAALEKPTLTPLRSFNHVDTFGNPISEPDISNPTRPRWERPLDTIKSFEAAIDTEYKRRSLMRADTAPDAASTYQSRRNSYYGGNNERAQTRHSNVGGYYGNGSNAGRENYQEQNYGPPVAGPSRSRYNQRMMSDSQAGRFNQGSQMYPNANYHQSRDTVNTGGSGSGSEPWANNTDPSSENSSIDRAMPVTRPDVGEQYGFSGFGGAPIMEEHGQNHGYSNSHMPPPGAYFPPNHPSAVTPMPPIPPEHGSGNRPIPLGGSDGNQGVREGSANRPRTLTRNESGEKRKSWFKRRFSKD